MPAKNRPSPYPDVGGSYYYPGEDFETWRVQFEALRERHQWKDAVAKQLAFAYMRDSATEAVMDIPFHGPETLTQVLNAYQTRFELLEDFVRLRLQREGLLRGSRCRCQPGRRRSLLKPRGKRGILAPACRQPYIKNTGRTVRVSTPGGRLAELTPPPSARNIRR